LILTYIPGNCQFMAPGDTAPDVPDVSMLPAIGATDSTVYCVESRHSVPQAFSPFVYGEAGFVLNGPFDGAGPLPSLNGADYGQYVAGAGIGLPIAGYVIASVGYRYLRLNNRTPCEACSGRFIVNTNTINAVIITLGVQFR
jgi:hypothetical protein